MKNIRIGTVPVREALHFLGWRGSPVEPELICQIRQFCEELDNALTARVMVRSFPYDGDTAAGTRFSPLGEDIRGMLSGCGTIVLMAATLGAQSEQLLLRKQARSAYDAMLMDAVMSAAIEHVCDMEEARLRCEALSKGDYLTDRFSPGYGDMPLSQSREIMAILDADRSIGLTTSETGLMIPRKSVVAVMGVSSIPVPHRERGCGICAMRESCSLAKSEQSIENN